jgi:hypothetical protein
VIVGSYSEDRGAEILAVLFIPGIANALEISFLVDSGANVTAIARRDLARLPPEVWPALSFRERTDRLTGIGGSVPWLQFDGGLTFSHENHSTTMVAQSLAILLDNDVPSLLGRDILSHGVLTLDGPGRRVTFDIPEGFLR